MDTDTQQTPDPGPPKKGFWGFLAGLFPKQPKPHDHVEPSSESTNPAEHVSDEQTPAPAQPQQPSIDVAVPQPTQEPASVQPVPSDPTPTATPEQSATPTIPTDTSANPAPIQSETPTDPLAIPVPTIKPDHDPQPLAVPGNLEAQPIEADGTKVSPTLATQEPGAGDPASEHSEQTPPTPQPGTNPPAPTQQS